jgi:hypothetical protein
MNDAYYFAMATKTHTLAQIQAKNPGKLVVVDPGKTKGGMDLKKTAKAHNKAVKAKSDAGKLKVVDTGKTKGGIDIKKVAKAHNKAIQDHENAAREQKHKAETTSHPVASDLHAKSAVNHQVTAEHLKAVHPSHLQAHQHAVERRMVHFNDPVTHHLIAAKQAANVAADQQHKAEQVKHPHPSHLQAHEHAVEARQDSAASNLDSHPDLLPGQSIPKPDNSMLPVQNENFGFTNETKNKTSYNMVVGNNPRTIINPNVHPKAIQTEPKGFIPTHPIITNQTMGTSNPSTNPSPNLAFPDVGKGLTNVINSIGQTLNPASIPSQIINTPSPQVAKNPIRSITTPPHHHFKHHISVQQTFNNPQKLAEFNAQPKAVKIAEINRQIQQHSNLIKSINAENLHSHPDSISIQADKLAKASGGSGMDMGGQLTPQELATLKADSAEDSNTALNIKFAPQGYDPSGPQPKNKIILNTITHQDGTQTPIIEPQNQTEMDKLLKSSNLAKSSGSDITIGVIGIGAILFLSYMISKYI